MKYFFFLIFHLRTHTCMIKRSGESFSGGYKKKIFLYGFLLSLLFIVSEAMLFGCIFRAYFYKIYNLSYVTGFWSVPTTVEIVISEYKTLVIIIVPFFLILFSNLICITKKDAHLKLNLTRSQLNKWIHFYEMNSYSIVRIHFLNPFIHFIYKYYIFQCLLLPLYMIIKVYYLNKLYFRICINIIESWYMRYNVTIISTFYTICFLTRGWCLTNGVINHIVETTDLGKNIISIPSQSLEQKLPHDVNTFNLSTREFHFDEIKVLFEKQSISTNELVDYRLRYPYVRHLYIGYSINIDDSEIIENIRWVNSIIYINT